MKYISDTIFTIMFDLNHNIFIVLLTQQLT